MNRTSMAAAACAVLLSALCATCCAQAGDAPGPVLDIPLAGPPPEGDGLPPTAPEAAKSASMQMLLLVVVALAAIFLLLRLVSRGRRQPLPPTPEQELLERAKKALDTQDRHMGDDGGQR